MNNIKGQEITFNIKGMYYIKYWGRYYIVNLIHQVFVNVYRNDFGNDPSITYNILSQFGKIISESKSILSTIKGLQMFHIEWSQVLQ